MEENPGKGWRRWEVGSVGPVKTGDGVSEENPDQTVCPKDLGCI